MRRCAAALAAALATACVAAAPPAGAQNSAARMWRMSGRVTAADGRAFDYSVTFFRYAGARGGAIYPASLSIVDEERHTLFVRRRTERSTFGLAGSAADRLAIHVGDWTLSGNAAREQRRAFDLNLREPGAWLVLHGVARKPRISFAGGPQSPQVVTYPSIATSGTLVLDDRRIAVSGTSWLDVEDASRVSNAAHERFGCYHVQLDDGREIFIQTSGRDAYGMLDTTAFLVRRDGSVEALSPSGYAFREHLGTTWRSTRTNALYPSLWTLRVPGQTESMLLQPVMFDQESRSAGDGASYWDGAVDVYDVTLGSQGLRLGSGYVLLTGFAKDAAAQ